jgi:large-conductance mechanosensitive channel
MDFFSKFNVLGLAIGLMIGSNLKDVASDFIDDVLMPFVEPILLLISGKKENGIKITIPNTNITIDLKRVISSFTKFMALSVIIFVMLQFGIKLKKPVQWVSVRNWSEMSGRKRKKVSLT